MNGERAYAKIIWRAGGKVKVKKDEMRMHAHNLLRLHFYLHVLIPLIVQNLIWKMWKEMHQYNLH